MLGAGGVAGALIEGLDPLPAFAAAAAGGIVLALIGAGQSSRAALKGSRAALKGEHEPLDVPPDASFDPAWYAAVLACVPSTIGVGLLTAIALAFSPALCAVLGGVLVAMGLLALSYGIRLVDRERREAARYWLERGPNPRRFVSPR